MVKKFGEGSLVLSHTSYCAHKFQGGEGSEVLAKGWGGVRFWQSWGGGAK